MSSSFWHFWVGIAHQGPTFCDWFFIEYISFSWSGFQLLGGARGVMVTVVGNGHGDTSSNPGRDWLHFP